MNEEMKYMPVEKAGVVVGKGEFIFATMGLNHGHVHGMSRYLMNAGAEIKWVYDPDPVKVAAFTKQFPEARVARSEQEILDDAQVRLVACACVPSERGPTGLRVMDHGKDFFVDKTPFTTFDQLEAARMKVKQTGLKYAVFYSERIQSEAGVHAGELIRQGAIGRVIQVLGLGPHRLSAAGRPDWFFKRAQYGGILCDIGSHQCEQFLAYSGAQEASVPHSKVANYNHKQYPELEDFGDATLIGDNGATGYFRVDWFTPDGLGTWGDGRTFVLGTEGYIEMRKFIDLGCPGEREVIHLVTKEKEYRLPVFGKVGYPYFGQLILDCLNRTESAMTQKHAFKAAELCLQAQAQAVMVE